MSWLHRRAELLRDQVARPDDGLIRPGHVCKPPHSRLWGGGPERVPKDPEDCPPGTLWICECGKGWRVGGYTPTWVRDESLDVKELLDG